MLARIQTIKHKYSIFPPIIQPLDIQTVTIITCKDFDVFQRGLSSCEDNTKRLHTYFLLSVTSDRALPFNACTHRGYIDKCVPCVLHWLTSIDNVTRVSMVTKTKLTQCTTTRPQWAGQRGKTHYRESIYPVYKERRRLWLVLHLPLLPLTKSRYFLNTFIMQHICLPPLCH